MARRTSSTSGDTGRGQAAEVVAASLDLELEVAGTPADPTGELRDDPPGEVLEPIVAGVPGGKHRRPEVLDVPVDVADDRPDVVGGHDPSSAAGDGPQDEDDTEARQLVVGEQDRRPPERLEDLVERIGMDRRGQSVPDRRRSDRDARLGAPGVRRQMVGQLRDEQDGRVRPDGRADRMARRVRSPR